MSRGDLRHLRPIPTRWMGNDVYGHVNDVVHDPYFDTAVNAHPIEQAGLDVRTSPVVVAV